MEAPQLLSILDRASFFSNLIKSNQPLPQILSGKIVSNLFFENSTRTKFSFEVAEKRLGGHVLNFASDSSSLSKGESLYDTLKTFEALGTDIAVIRHSDDSYIEKMKEHFSFSIINAGAGKKDHPSQSLLDLMTIKEEFKTLDGLNILICGDVKSSRVAKSNIAAIKKFNSTVIISGPKDLIPQESSLEDHCKVMPLDEALKIADVAIFLRVQHERHQTFELSTDKYNENYGLNATRLSLLKESAIIMHPGPVNRDVEISSAIVEHEKSRIFKQMENGVYIRMAILEWILDD